MSTGFETKQFDLTGTPVDLVGDPHFNVQADLPAVFAFIQNIGTEEVLYRETSNAPGTNDAGHTLPAGAGLVVLLFGNFWIWSPEGSIIQVSQGAPMPVRGS